MLVSEVPQPLKIYVMLFEVSFLSFGKNAARNTRRSRLECSKVNMSRSGADALAERHHAAMQVDEEVSALLALPNRRSGPGRSPRPTTAH